MKASYTDRKTLESGSTGSPYLQIAKKLYEKTGCRENEGSAETINKMAWALFNIAELAENVNGAGYGYLLLTLERIAGI